MKDPDGLVCELSHEKELLLSRVKELEGENLRWRQDFDSLQKRLRQRDTALVECRKALEVFVSGATKIDLNRHTTPSPKSKR